MLIEGVDDSVVLVVSIFLIGCTTLMFNFIKSRVFSVSQINPTLHQDSVADVDRLRQGRDLSPSAPPQQDENARRNHHYNCSCPICLGDCFLPVETNCGHIFCGNCVVQYWNHAHVNIYSKMKCPMCRQLVSCLLPLYSIEEQQRNVTDNKTTFDTIRMYNNRFSGAPRPWLDYITDIPIILRHVFTELLSMNALDIWERIRMIFLIIFGLFYFLLPLDLIPEAVFGFFGFFDDLLVVLLVFIYICMFFRAIITNRR